MFKEIGYGNGHWKVYPLPALNEQEKYKLDHMKLPISNHFYLLKQQIYMIQMNNLAHMVDRDLLGSQQGQFKGQSW